MMKKYNFSEIKRCNKNNSFDRELLGKYFCQVFNQNGEYITYLVGDSYKEVVDKQKNLFKEEI